MNPIKRFSGFLIGSMLMVLFGCSQVGVPVSPSNTFNSSETIPLILADQSGMVNSLGVIGLYHLNIDPIDMTAELTTNRAGSIGEGYIVSGMAFFTVAPCTNCLMLAGFELTGGNLALKFKIRHPFPPGDPTQPPTARNRLDLDVFDLAMVINPLMATPINFPEIGIDVIDWHVANADGYTRELANLINNDAAMPYVLVVDNSQSDPPHTYNKFGMGVESFFDVFFRMTPGLPLRFDMYLTMGYGASAKKPQRLTPKYYNPEFNRKAAWKVEVSTYGPWLDTPIAPTIVEVEVYDWQIGATVYTGADFENAPQNNIYAVSGVDYVKVEIPGMAPATQVDTPTIGTGSPHDPLIYEVPIVNANLLPPGSYLGLVQVMDERRPLSPADGRDFLIDSPDGIILNNYDLPEYATYQTFPVEVVHEGITIYQNNYNLDGVKTKDSSTGSVQIGYVEPDVPYYFNLNINGIWVIQNAPVLPHNSDPRALSLFIDFPLMVPNGINVTEAIGGWSLTEFPMGPPPITDLIPVNERDVNAYSGEPGKKTIYEEPSLVICASIMGYASKFLGNQDCGPAECVPAAFANSLKMLQKTQGKPPKGKDISIGGMKTASGWAAGGCYWPNWANDKNDYMNNNGYQISTQVIQNPTAADLQHALDEMKRCQDIEIVGGAGGTSHAAAVKSITKLSDGKYVFGVNHDTDQNNPGGLATEDVTIDPSVTPPTLSGGTWFNGGTLGGIVIECPIL